MGDYWSRVTGIRRSRSVSISLPVEEYRLFKAIAEKSNMTIPRCVRHLIKLAIDDELKEV